MLSHIRCWEWLRAHPEHPAALVLEDDVCFDGPAFGAAWDDTVQRLLRLPREAAAVDVLTLGYFGEEAPRPVTVGRGRSATLRLVDGFFGMHCYCVTQEGADRLMRDAFPLELQSDGYVCTLAELGRLRLFLLPESVASQCQDDLQREGAWHTHVIRDVHHHTTTVVAGAAVGCGAPTGPTATATRAGAGARGPAAPQLTGQGTLLLLTLQSALCLVAIGVLVWCGYVVRPTTRGPVA